MLNIYLDNGCYGKSKAMEVFLPISGKQLIERVQNTLGAASHNFFLKNNGRLIETNEIITNGDLLLVPKLCGGKGGFGSMLRAIGAQIEKTTNREACRDLSGRRLRDINEEKRLKAWIEKQSERKEEAAERKKKKLEKLCAQPKHEFKDKAYDQQRSVLTERVEEAVEIGFAAASTLAVKRLADQPTTTNPKKKMKTILDLDDDIDLSDLDSSDDSDTEKETKVEKDITDSKKNIDINLSDSNQSGDKSRSDKEN
ncbi:protein SDE2 homolog [Copidosoma floridanum]|uniref:protein SDE2 homolog n=1 Tax=Copidosoma floridanum TaxID=29053 RepID=UPI0006C94A7D|nr:protein SDE2 homolog [Copidosoma floridanum]